MSYNLGTAHGKIDLDYEGGREAAKAEEDIDKLRASVDKSDDSFKRFDASAKKLSSTLGKVAKTAAIMGASSLALNGSLNLVAATIAGLAALTPVVGAALAALPAIILGGVAALVILKAATAGVGDALKAAGGDVEAFNKTLEKLSPQAREFAQAWREALAVLKPVQQAIQDAFFSGLGPLLTTIVKRVSTLRAQAVGVAAALNRIVKNVAQWGASNKSIENFRVILSGVNGFLLRIQDSIGPVIAALIDIGAQASVFGDTLGGKVANALAAFTRYLRGVDVAALFERASVVLQQLGGFLSDVLTIARELFSVFNVDGESALGVIGQLASKLADFLESAEGQAALQAIGEAMAAISGAAGQVFLALLQALAPILVALAPGVAELATQLAAVLVPAIQIAGPLLEKFAQFLSDNMGWIGPVAIALGGLTAAYKAYTVAANLANGAGLVWKGLVKGMPKITKAWTAANAALSASFLANPYVLAAIAIAAVIAAIILIATKTDWFQRLWNWAWGGIKDAAKAVADWFTGTIVPAFQGAWDSIAGFFTGAWDKIKAVLSIFSEGFKTWWDEVKFIPEGIGKVFQSGFGLARSAVEAAWSVISALFEVWKTVMGAIFTPIIEGIVAVFQWGWDSIKRGIEIFWGWIGPYVTAAWDILFGLFRGALDTIVKTSQELWDLVTGIITRFWDWIGPYVTGAIGLLGDLIGAGWERIKEGARLVWEGIKIVFTNAWEAIKTTFNNAVKAVVFIFDGLKKMVDNVKRFFNELKAAAQGGVGSLLSFVGGIPGRVLGAIGDLGNLLYNAGRNLITGLINGIIAQAGELLRRARDLAQQVLDQFTGIFDLGSPSKKTFKFGQFLTIGLSNGMESLIGKLQRVSAQVAVAALPVIPAVAGANTVNSFTTHAESMASQSATAGVPGITIQNLNVSLQGVWDFNDPAAARRIATQVHTAIEDLKREYR